MARITAQEAGGANVCAFVDMIAYSENKSLLKITDDGYNVMVGSMPERVIKGVRYPAKLLLVPNYADHPRVLNRAMNSTAAGRYQFLTSTWDSLRKQLGLSDFSPINQDRACIALVKGRGALKAVQQGAFEAALYLCRKEWASLPGAGYGQGENSAAELLTAYKAAGGKVIA